MNSLAALETVVDLTTAALTLLSQAQKISSLVAKAQSEGRDVTTEEMEAIIREDDAAKVALNAAILKNKRS